MAREIPEFVRAAAGLAATLLDEARKLPETLPGLSVRVVGLAMQTAMKVQQGYSGLVARGDELFTGIRGADEPGLATFDDEVEAQTGGYRESKFDRADVTFTDNEVLDELAIDETLATAPPAKATPAKRAARKQAAKTPPGRKQTAKTAPPAKKAARARAGAPDVVTGGEAAVDEALGGAPELTAPAREAPSSEPAAEASTTESPATATDEGGGTVAAATGVRTDEGGSDTSADDAAIAEGAAVDAVGGESAAPTDDAQGGSELSGSQAAGTAPVAGYDGWSIAQLRDRLRGYAESTVRELVDYEQATRAREPYLRMLRNRLEGTDTEG